MILRAAVVATSLTLLANCSSNDSSGGSAPPPSDDAEGVSASDFDPAKPSAIDANALTDVLSEESTPIVPNFSSASRVSRGQGPQMQSLLFSNLMADESFSECVIKTPPILDRVTAAGSDATVDVKYDWSNCLKNAMTSAGGTVSSAQCTVALQMAVKCPSKDFTPANGKNHTDARSDLGMGVSDCKLADGASGSVKRTSLMSCSLAGTVSGKPVSLRNVTRNGFISSSGGACEFKSAGSQMILGDCMNASSEIDNQVNPSGEKTSTHVIIRQALKDAKFSAGSFFYDNGQTFGFDVNNWKGRLTTTASGATYSLSNGSETKTGQIEY